MYCTALQIASALWTNLVLPLKFLMSPPRYVPLGGFGGGQKRRRRLMLGFTLEIGLSTVGGHNENRGWGGVQKPNVLNYVRNQTVTMRPEQASCLRRRSYVEFANLATIWPINKL